MTRINTMSKLSDSGNGRSIEVISGVQRRRRWTPFEKLEMVKPMNPENRFHMSHVSTTFKSASCLPGAKLTRMGH